MNSGNLVPEHAIDYDEVFRRGGRNCGDEDFALFKCPHCQTIYLIEYEVDTVYLDPLDLSKRVSVDIGVKGFTCSSCGELVPGDQPWIGPDASSDFLVTWNELGQSPWRWIASL